MAIYFNDKCIEIFIYMFQGKSLTLFILAQCNFKGFKIKKPIKN